MSFEEWKAQKEQSTSKTPVKTPSSFTEWKASKDAIPEEKKLSPEDIPGSIPQPKPTIFTGKEAAVGALETAASVGSSIYGFTAGLASAGAEIALGHGLKQAEETFGKVSEEHTYSPRTKAGKEQVESVGEAFDRAKIPMYVPGVGKLPSIKTAGKYIKEKISPTKVAKEVVKEEGTDMYRPTTEDDHIAKWKEPTAVPDKHLVETAFKDKTSGEVKTTGFKHPEDLKEATKDTHEQGFVDKSGKFLTRKEAEARARETGQIPKDQKIERPEEGLHSGDLRTARDPKFDSPVKLGAYDVEEGGKGIARRNKDTGAIEVNPEEVKRSYESSGPADRPHIKEKFKTPEEYQRFIIEHEQEHGRNPQIEGETTLDYETRTTKQAIENLKPKAVPHPAEIINESDFHTRGREILSGHGEEAARGFYKAVEDYKTKYHVKVSENLADDLYNHETIDKANDSQARLLVEKAEKEGIPIETRHKWLLADDGAITLPPEEAVIKSKFLDSVIAEANALAKKKGEILREDYQPHLKLYDKSTVEKTLGKWWEDVTRTEGAFSQKMAETPDALQERSVYVIEKPNGTREVIQLTKGGVVKWENGKQVPLAKGETTLKVGDSALGGVIKEASITEKEHHTPNRYSKDSLYNWLTRLNELRKFDRETTYLTDLLSSPHSEKILMDLVNKDTGKLNDIPKGWTTPKYIERIPELVGKVFDPKTAAILEDWAKVYDKSMYMNLTSMLIKNMMLNPIPHIFNEMAHSYIFRGASGWFTPKGVMSFVKTAKGATKDVLDQGPLYQEVLREGGSLLSADVRNKEFIRDLHTKAEEYNLKGTPESQKTMATIAAKVGMKPLELYNAWSKASNKAMWVSRDIMYMQLIREVKGRDPLLSTKEAINYVEKHMPNYRLPSEIGGSRTLSKVLGDPRIAVFSRYHHGVVKSMMETVKDVHPKNLQSVDGRKAFIHGLDSIVAAGMAFGLLYPIMDEIAKKVFGLDNAEQRRAGPFHVLQAASEVAGGKKDTQALLAPVFTFNPMFLYTGQLLANRQLYSGKQIFHPDDPAGTIASDVGQYTAKSVPQYGPMTQGMEGGEGTQAFAAKQFDVRAKTSEQTRKMDVQQKYADRNLRSRERKRRIEELRGKLQ